MSNIDWQDKTDSNPVSPNNVSVEKLNEIKKHIENVNKE